MPKPRFYNNQRRAQPPTLLRGQNILPDRVVTDGAEQLTWFFDAPIKGATLNNVRDDDNINAWKQLRVWYASGEQINAPDAIVDRGPDWIQLHYPDISGEPENQWIVYPDANGNVLFDGARLPTQELRGFIVIA